MERDANVRADDASTGNSEACAGRRDVSTGFGDLFAVHHALMWALGGGHHPDEQGRLPLRVSPPPRQAELARMVQDIGRRRERLVNRPGSDDAPSTHRQLQLLAATGVDITARRPPRRWEPSRRVRRYEASYGYFSLEAGSRTGGPSRA
jgi:hypothetical protein